jgi:hypothetical protein
MLNVTAVVLGTPNVADETGVRTRTRPIMRSGQAQARVMDTGSQVGRGWLGVCTRWFLARLIFDPEDGGDTIL